MFHHSLCTAGHPLAYQVCAVGRVKARAAAHAWPRSHTLHSLIHCCAVWRQAATRPPTFVCFVNDASLFTDDYRRYLERQLRDNVGFPSTPLRIYFRGKAPRTNAGGGRPAAPDE